MMHRVQCIKKKNFPNTERKDENIACNSIFLMNFEENEDIKL